MREYKGMLWLIVFAIAILGVSYAYFSINRDIAVLANYVDSGSITYHTRDFERNIYIAEPKKDTRVVYSVVQGKNIKAMLTGLSPSHVLVKNGETVKFSIKSDVNCNFFVSGYGVSAKAWPDTTTEVAFNADMPGIYAYGCRGFLSQDVGLLEVVR